MSCEGALHDRTMSPHAVVAVVGPFLQSERCSKDCDEGLLDGFDGEAYCVIDVKREGITIAVNIIYCAKHQMIQIRR